MKLTRVSITGADDGVDPLQLLSLSVEFPFVEWGILYSESRVGTPRYPTAEWRENLLGLKLGTPRGSSLQLALHLCGKSAREVFAGKPSRWFARKDFHAPYERVQLNGFSPYKEALTFDVETLRFCPCEFIVQCADEQEIRIVDEFALKNDLNFLNALFDPSGGRGVRTETWDHPETRKVSVGYAGGIGPDNVADVIDKITSRPRSIFPDKHRWIDMESRVRDEHDAFDLDRVRAVLNSCKPHFSP